MWKFFEKFVPLFANLCSNFVMRFLTICNVISQTAVVCFVVLWRTIPRATWCQAVPWIARCRAPHCKLLTCNSGQRNAVQVNARRFHSTIVRQGYCTALLHKAHTLLEKSHLCNICSPLLYKVFTGWFQNSSALQKITTEQLEPCASIHCWCVSILFGSSVQFHLV